MDGPQDLMIGQVLLFFGLILQCLGMMSLRRSIGLVPANRGIVTDGLYQFVRHPLYCASTFVLAGYLINHPTEHNVLVFALWFGLQMLRIFNEERFLSAEKPYREFMTQTFIALGVCLGGWMFFVQPKLEELHELDTEITNLKSKGSTLTHEHVERVALQAPILRNRSEEIEAGGVVSHVQ